MALQETITNATANLPDNTAAVVTGVAAVAVLALVLALVFALGADQILQVTDVRLPWRQLMAGRSLYVLTLSSRFFYTIVGNYIAARLTARRGSMQLFTQNGRRTTVRPTG